MAKIDYDGKYKYDKNIAINYDQDRQNEKHWIIENQYVSNKFAGIKNVKILDIPVGTGRFLKYYTNNKIFGIDVSEEMLNQSMMISAKLGLSNLQLQLGDATKLDFPESFFDYTVCFRLIHLIPPELRLDLLTELKRVTKDHVIIQTYEDVKLSFFARAISKISNFFARLKIKNKSTPWSHITSYPLESYDFIALLNDSALTIVEETLLCRYCNYNVKVYVLKK